MIQLNGVVLCAHLGQERLGGFAVWAIGLAEYGYTTTMLASAYIARYIYMLGMQGGVKRTNSILLNDLLGLGSSSRHVCGIDRSRSEESA